MFRRLFGCLFDVIATLAVIGGAWWAVGHWGPDFYQYLLQPRALQSWAGDSYHQWLNESSSGQSFSHWLSESQTGRKIGQWLDETLPEGQSTVTVSSAAGNYTGACPAVLSGHFTSPGAGRRIQLKVAVPGSTSAIQSQAILDSGAVQTAFPDQMLRKLGFTPISGPHQVGGVGSGSAVAYTYRIPYPLVSVSNHWIPLGKGSLTVEGIRNFDMVLIGPDVLENGVSLQTQGSNWSLTIPCQKS
ncbi:MAG: hypothetical protein ACM3XM_15260 [Mycobacterium leprae]